jgi:MFS family permease
VTIFAAALAPSLPVVLAVLVVAGFASTSFLATGNSTLQLTSDAGYRGRVMALWSVTFLGSTPIGGPIIGAVAEYFGPRYGLAVGGVAALGRLPRSERFAPRPPDSATLALPVGVPEPSTLETELPEL